MGGYGSGRPGSRIPVEHCKSLAVRDVRAGILAGPGYAGGLTWSLGERKTGSVDFAIVNAGRHGLGLRLRYTIDKGTANEYRADYVVPFTHAGQAAGWYFECRASVNGGPPCGRAVRKLYLPPGGGVVFACRHCYRLTYTSCNDSHKYDGMFARLAAGVGEPGLDGRTIKRLFGRRYGG